MGLKGALWKVWVGLSVLFFVVLGLIVLGSLLPGSSSQDDSPGIDWSDDTGDQPETHTGRVTLTKWTNDYYESLDAAMGVMWQGEVYDADDWEMPARDSDSFPAQGIEYKCQGDTFRLTVAVETKDGQATTGDEIRLSCVYNGGYRVSLYVDSQGRPTVMCRNCGS